MEKLWLAVWQKDLIRKDNCNVINFEEEDDYYFEDD